METRKTVVLFGGLKRKDIGIEVVRAEVFLDPLNTSDLRADIYDIDGNASYKLMKFGFGEPWEFESKSTRQTTRFVGTVNGVQSSSTSDKIATIGIREFRTEYLIESCPIIKITLRFFLEPIQIFERARQVVRHDTKGLLFGWNDWKEANIETWEDEEFSYETTLGKLIFYPGLVFSDKVEDSFEVREQTKAWFVVSGQNLLVDETFAQAERVLDSYLRMVSFFEKRFLGWRYSEIDARGEKGKGIVVEKYQWRPGITYQSSQHIKTNQAKYRSQLKLLVDRYLMSKDNVREEIDKAIRQMVIGNRPDQAVESKLIYWHSALDIHIKIVAGEKAREQRYEAFSKKLVLACEDAGIVWTDLYPYLTRERIFSEEKADFLITSLRNAMIHEGKYPDSKEYNQVFQENARAEALAERMVMRILGVDYEGTPVGEFRGF